MDESSETLLSEINKRITLNLLIQGSAQHAFLTSHHLVRDELAEIHPELLLLYDKFAIAVFLQFWYGETVLISGCPGRFWKRVARPRHPFCRHPFLVRHGAMLANAAKERAVERSRAKGVWRLPIVFSLQLMSLSAQLQATELDHKRKLVELAKRATHLAWDIPPDRLDAELTERVRFGELSRPATTGGKVLRASAVGYGGVLRQGPQLKVVAKGWVWPVLSHELVKGTAELVCLHGLNGLVPDVYARVLKAADKVEYEPWMLPVGAELWRRLLLTLPKDWNIAEVLMHIARLPPRSLEALMMAVVENPEWARELIAGLRTPGHAQ